jgi:RNA polymerase sigma-70 factor (ECF subfamily)
MNASQPSSPFPKRRPPVVARDTREIRTGLVQIVPELRSRALRLTGNPAMADDLVQDTVERALKFEAQYERGTNLRAWALSILFSVFVTRYRQKRRERNALRVLAHDPNAWTQPDGDKPDARISLTKRTTASLAALPPGFRAAIVMVDLEERSYRDAATMLGVPVGTVMSRLHRGRKMLKEALAA